jgi:hypothetical protein
LANYLLRKFPTAPPSINYTAKAMPSLSDVYGNDVSGCCTCSSSFHIAATLLANSNAPVPFVAQDVLNLYILLSGWDGKDDKTDTGLSEQQVLNYWSTIGLSAAASPGIHHRITGYIAVDPSDAGELKSSLWLFENNYFAMNLPSAYIDPMPSANGFVWDVAGMADPEAGHAFCGVGYNSDGVIIDSWGYLGLFTWSAIAKYATVYTALGPDSIDLATQKSPAGFNYTQLVSDLQSMGAVEQ